MIKQLTATVGAVLLAGGVALAQPATWEIDSAHSTVGFSVRHMMVSNVRGTFNGVKG